MKHGARPLTRILLLCLNRTVIVLCVLLFRVLHPSAGSAQEADASVRVGSGFGLTLTRTVKAPVLLIHEPCDDVAFTQRGWYDNNSLRIAADEHVPGSAGALEYRFLKGSATPTSGGGVRRLFTPSPNVYLSYWVKYSANWEGSNRPYHPHEFHFVTNVDDKWIGPAATHLTTYIEHNEGRPLLSMQDALNIDESNIGRDLTNVTEDRAVAGCNGSSDAWPAGDCYLSGSTHRNGKAWKSASVIFSDTPGPLYKNAWRFVEAQFSLNRIVDGKGVADGVIRMWVDGELIVDAPGVMLRTGRHPSMQFNQFLIAPYIGDGSPVEQTMWVDEIVVATDRLAVLGEPILTSPPHYASLPVTDCRVTWTPVAGASAYNVERAEDSLFSADVRSDTVHWDTTHVFSGMQAGSSIWWRVRAENPAGKGEWSEARMFRVSTQTSLNSLPVPGIDAILVSPHPVKDMATFFITVADEGWVELSLFDELGRRGEVFVRSWMTAGEYEYSLDASRLLPGLYLARLSIHSGSIFKSFVILH